MGKNFSSTSSLPKLGTWNFLKTREVKLTDVVQGLEKVHDEA
jgi:hypothetical protein